MKRNEGAGYPEAPYDESLVDGWAEIHADAQDPRAFGEALTYAIAASYLRGCAEVHDWGCGTGYLRGYVPEGQPYLGIDGTRTQWANVVTDLTDWKTPAEGVVLRHVLEHNPAWRTVLQNAVRSTRVRLAVIFFVPLCEGSAEQDMTPWGPYRNLALPGDGVVEIIERELHIEAHYTIATDTEFGSETMILAARDHSWRPHRA